MRALTWTRTMTALVVLKTFCAGEGSVASLLRISILLSRTLTSRVRVAILAGLLSMSSEVRRRGINTSTKGRLDRKLYAARTGHIDDAGANKPRPNRVFQSATSTLHSGHCKRTIHVTQAPVLLSLVRLNRRAKLWGHGRARRRMKLASLRPGEPHDVNSSIELEKRIPYLVDRPVRPGPMA